MKKYIAILVSMIGLVVMSLFVISCEDDRLEVQQAYEFSLNHMPIPTKIHKGDKVEMRCELSSEGNYKDAKYTIRYFQNEGIGLLQMDNKPPLYQNDRYDLKLKEFRLYYTAVSKGQHKFDVYIEDNFGKTVKKSFEFNAD